MFDVKLMFRGCKINISFPSLALFTAILLLECNSALPLIMLAILAHELGHIGIMVLKKCSPTQIYLRAFSVDIIDANKRLRNYNADLFILIAGALTNLILSSVFYIAYSCFKISWILSFVQVNIFFAAFNLLPIAPFDGGQIVLNLFLRKLKLKNAEKLLHLISFIVLVPLAILGFCVLLQSKYNFSLLFLSCYLMAILLIKNKSCYY